jgi:hypothetical protein
MNPFNPRPWEKDPVWQRDHWCVGDAHREAAGIWTNTQALREMLGNVRAQAMKKLANVSPSSGPDNVTNRIAELRFKAVAVGQELAAVEALLRAAEESPEFKLAQAHWAPLVKAAEEKLARDEKVRLDRQRKEAELVQAREATWKRALERAEEDPAIKKAARELEVAKAAEAEL